MSPRLSPRRLSAAGAAAAALALAATPTASATTKIPGPFWSSAAFAHTGTFTVADNLRPTDPAGTETSSEIIDATSDGRTLIYTDSPTGRIGFIDITNPSAPKPKGALDVGGEPTSVKTYGRYALVAVNTSESFTNPSGKLLVVDTKTQQPVTEFALAGQPDSIDVAPSGRYAAIVIENERDEDLNDGLIPQLPAGTLQILKLSGPVSSWAGKLSSVDLTGLDATAPSDPEPEFVDINRRDQAVVSLQENNHLAIVDLRTGKVIRHFSAGTVSLSGIDGTEEEQGPQGSGLIELSDVFTDRRREPDAVQWVDDTHFATANEGDYEDENGQEGGTRGATIFNDRGRVVWDSGTELEYAVTRAGHFPMDRAENKGNEPEGLEVATIAGQKYLFVGSERANTAAVYAITGSGPKFKGLLPTGVGPEGLRAIPSRGLFVVSAETDDPALARSIVTIYKAKRGAAQYPQLVSKNEAGTGKPIPWVAISGLSADPHDKGTIWAVSDSALAQSWLYKVDVRRTPAAITQRIPIGTAVSPADQKLGEFDLEGVAARPEGGFWFASEGRTNAGSSRPNLIVRTDAAGAVQQSIALPAGLVAGATSSGFEGVSVTGSARKGNETVYVAVQREWADDPAGTVKLGKYDVASGQWTFVRYPLGAVESPAGGWVGLSEITVLGDGRTALIVERDNQIGQNARIKRLYKVDLGSAAWKPFGETLETLPKVLAKDVIGDLASRSITVPDKLEGVAVTKTGRVWLATDNDALDGNYGETLFFPLGGRR